MQTRYFIYAHEASFDECRLEGLEWSEDGLYAHGQSNPASLTTPILDSGENANVWKRVLADIVLETGTKIIWRLYASDTSEMADDYAEAYTAQNTCDFLPINVKGRYLRLEVLIYGVAKLKSLIIYQSLESFLDYLPEIYRDYDSFSDRFLSLFAVQYFELERKIGEFAGALNPAVAPPDTLIRLAELVGVAHINLWETEGLRGLLSSGIYKRHGQFSVFADYVEYFSGHRPYIAEHYKYRNSVPHNDSMYTDADVTVFMPPEAAGINMEALRVVIDDFLPSDIICRVIILDPHPVISGGAILGVNTCVGRYEQTVVGSARVGVTLIGGEQ